MENLNVEFKFFEEIDILVGSVFVPGSRVIVTVLDQSFIRDFVIDEKVLNELRKNDKDYTLKKAELFGDILIDIGKDIIRQAKYGIESTIETNGKIIKTFGRKSGWIVPDEFAITY